MPLLSLTLNGQAVSREVAPHTLLVDFIREHMRLTGTHVGCDTGQCGACTVHLDGRAVKSCNMLAAQAQGRSVTTIEGVAAADGTLHPMQEAFREYHALQCGFCTPGMVMSAIEVAKHNSNPSEHDVREWLAGDPAQPAPAPVRRHGWRKSAHRRLLPLPVWLVALR